ncbi:MAG: lipopolysaccharide core heptose(II) kinase RfaY [Eggerthellaceae bacterium]|jgi:ubiquinone biosynthesis protein|nr:lipopolysaccharide core heptose(II) kinase RfaY [Eggerthellaceae bacterium]
MAENSLLKYMFRDGAEVDPDQKFGLSRKSRMRRLREIIKLMRKHRVQEGLSPDQLRSFLIDLGPSFIKIGQMLSLRSEILPQAYCDALSDLQMDCDPMPFEDTLAALEDVYGSRFHDIFRKIDPKPLGSASLAQVHKAELSNGDVVAVKVQRPGVRAVMAQDIDVMRSVAKHVSRFMKDTQMLDLRDVVEELWATFLEETDFMKEANNLREFAELNKDVVFISCPKPYMEYCTESVLVMEYIEGVSIRDTKRLKELGYDLDEIGLKVMDNYATQILEHGFFHADPHPGNLFVHEGKVVYLDLGIMGRLSVRERMGFSKIIEAVGAQNASDLKDALISFSVEHDLASIDHARLLAELDNVLKSYCSTNVADIDIGALLSDIMALTRQCRVTLPSSVTAVSRGIVTMEGSLAEYLANTNMIEIINGHIIRSKNTQEELETRIKTMLVSFDTSLRSMLKAAEYSGEMFRMLSRGQLKVNMEMLGSTEPLRKVSRIANRLAMSLVIAGLLVSGSLIISVDMPRVFGLPILSFIEYVSAFVLFIWMAWDMFRKTRRP